MTDKNSESHDSVLSEIEEIFSAGRRDLSDVLHREILMNALKVKRANLDLLDLKVLSRSMAEFRYAARVFKPYRHERKVSIFGSARTPEDDPYYKMAVEFAKMLAENNFMVITGAADGIMKAGNVGAGAEKSFGVNILLPFEQAPNEVIGDDPKLITFKYFFTRKLFFLMEAHAVALFPGGFGTHDEGFETLTLVQTGKAPPMPLLLMALPDEDYWKAYDHFIRTQLLARGLISDEDLDLYKIIYSPQEGVDWVKHYYSTYHSIRHVRSKLVIRLEKELSDEHIDMLNTEFDTLVAKGKMERCEPQPDEVNEHWLADKPRIIFHYNRKNPSRLNRMILRINELGKSA